jgi:hypothetical protein
VFSLEEDDQSFGVFPVLDDEISVAAWSEDGSLVAVGTASGQIAVGFVPDAIPKLGGTLSWLYMETPHAVRIDHILFCPRSKRQLVVSIDSKRVLTLSDLAIRDTVQLLLPTEVLAMRRAAETIVSMLEGGSEIVTWNVRDSVGPDEMSAEKLMRDQRWQ